MIDERKKFVVSSGLSRIRTRDFDLSPGQQTELQNQIRQALREAYDAGYAGLQHDLRELLNVATPEED